MPQVPYLYLRYNNNWINFYRYEIIVREALLS
jgi:hypothetical protein